MLTLTRSLQKRRIAAPKKSRKRGTFAPVRGPRKLR